MVTTETDKRSAFPLLDNGEILSPGLSKRELFAAMALQGLLSRIGVDGRADQFAHDAVKLADALLKRLGPTGENEL